MPRYTLSLVLSAGILLLATGRTQAQIAYTTNGVQLFSFDLSTPGTVTNLGVVSGDALFLDGLDFRPADGKLYGYVNNQIVLVNVTNAVTTFVSTPDFAPAVSDLGIDFNPTVDRLRLVNVVDQNLRITPAGGATTVDGTLAYAAGDPNVGVNPSMIEVAYTNSDNDPVTGTQLYYIDSVLDILATTSNPNAGTLNTVGSLGVNTTNLVGFDIFTNGGSNLAYAILDTGFRDPTPNLYSINLATGAATLIGPLGGTAQAFYYALAITTPVPEPSTFVLGAFGLIALAIWRRRSVYRPTPLPHDR